MAFAFHTDKPRYFQYQAENSKAYIIPFVVPHFEPGPGKRVLEIGCAEGGVLLPFLEAGCHCTGIELMPGRLNNARRFLEAYHVKGQARLLASNIYDVEPNELHGHFDLIILKDVIEHIPDQNKLLARLKLFLNPGGSIFFGFPPWYMPFGGHQQIAQTKIIKAAAWLHLLPMPLYKAAMRVAGEPDRVINDLVEIKETGISIERFERISKRNGYKLLKRTYWLLNPIYAWKFGWKPRKQLPVLGSVPLLRNVVNTAVYYLISVK